MKRSDTRCPGCDGRIMRKNRKATIRRCRSCHVRMCDSCSIGSFCVSCYTGIHEAREVETYFMDKYGRALLEVGRG